MGESWSIILLLLPLIAGAIAVFFSFQLMKRYQGSFTGSYFYYIVFLYIFGVYSLAGSGILQYALKRMEVSQQVIHTARFYTLLLGVPFLLLSKFMLFRSIADLRGIRLSSYFTVPYFIAGFALFAVYGIFIVRLNFFHIGEYALMMNIQRTVFILLMAIIYISLFVWANIMSKKSADPAQRNFLKVFVSWYLLYMLFTTISFALIPLHPIVPFIFLFLFLSWHLVPILFLNLYLEKNQGPSSATGEDFDTRLRAFTETFEISQREQEVVRLICKGMSNQEISDELFISLQTVKDHVHRIFLKTGVRNRVQLTNLIRSTRF
jgi:DNA-binding CsgD family transcriptional regulator